MLEVRVIDANGQPTGTLELNPDVFGVELRGGALVQIEVTEPRVQYPVQDLPDHLLLENVLLTMEIDGRGHLAAAEGLEEGVEGDGGHARNIGHRP